MPHELTTRNLIDRIEICNTLLKHNEMEPFLKRLITGDENWIKYENVKRKRSCSKRCEVIQMTAKPGLTVSKVMLKGRCVPPRQRQATQIFNDSSKIDWTWLRSFDAPIVCPEPCTVWLSFVSDFAKLPWWKKIGQQKGSWKPCRLVLDHKTTELLYRWNFETTRKHSHYSLFLNNLEHTTSVLYFK